MKKMFNLLLSAILVVTSFIGLGNIAVADGHGFPSKPIEVVTHAGLGGGTDTTARMLLIRTRKNLKNNAYITPKKETVVTKLWLMLNQSQETVILS